jgi:hypothetical protein
LLDDPQRPDLTSKLHLVTYGTPIRYGWDLGGCASLLHFVNHRPVKGMPEYLTRISLRPLRFWFGRDGDYIQQYGIAGTNFAPFIGWWRAFTADRRLNKLLQPDCSWRDLLTRMRRGVRVPEAGRTLLVKYGVQRDNPLRTARGHAVYTKRRWLPFQLSQIAQALTDKTGRKEPGS